MKTVIRVLVLLCVSQQILSAQFLSTPSGAYSWAFFPHLLDGGGWRTTFTISNPNLDSVSGTIYFRGGDGEYIYLDFGDGRRNGIQFTVPRLGSVEFKGSATNPDVAVGWATLAAKGFVQAVATYHRLKDDGDPQYAISVPATLPTVQYFSSATPSLGIAIANIYSSSRDINVVAVPNDGGSSFFGNITLSGNGQQAKLLSGLIPDLPVDFSGTVLITGEKDDFGEYPYFVALTLKDDGGFYSTLPSGAAARPVSHHHRIVNIFHRLIKSAGVQELLPDPDEIEIEVSYEREINAHATEDGIQINMALAELISDSESELAFTIGHELGHVYQFRTGTQGFSSNRELDADAHGLFFSLLAGYDPYAGAGALAKLEMASGRADLDSQYVQEITSAHLSFNTRLDHIYETIQEICDINDSTICERFDALYHPNVPRGGR